MLLGREEEQARIEALLDRARAGRSGALIVRGDPGIGKSALLDDARTRREGMRVFATRGVESEAELPFAALSELLRPALEALEAVPAPQRAALEAALALGPPVSADRFGAYAGCFSLLAEAAREGPLLALVDDAHWLDRSSAEALEFSARRLGEEGIALLFAAREEEPSAFEGAGIEELALAGLDPESSVRLLSDRSKIAVADDVAERLVEASGGNPLALRELPAVLSEEQLRGGKPLTEPLRLGPGLERVFQRRIAALPESTQRALLVAAASDSGAIDELSQALRGIGLGIEALEVAERAGLVALGNGRVEFRHPLLRSAAYHRASGEERRSAHRALAEALDSPADRAGRAWHLAAATLEPDEAVAAELEAAGREAAARGAPTAAARTLEAAARLTPEGEAKSRRIIEAAQQFHLAGTPEPARALLAEALAVADDPRLRADIQLLRARTEAMYGALPRHRDMLVDEAERVRAVDAVRAAAMLAEASALSSLAGEPRRSLSLAEEAFPASQRLGGVPAQIGAYLLSMASILCGEHREGRALLAQADDLLETPQFFALGWAANGVAFAHLMIEDDERARAFCVRLLKRARSEGAVVILPYLLAVLAEAEFRLGDWTSAYARGTESVTLAEETGQRGELSHSLVRVAEVEAGRGRAKQCREHIDRAFEIVDELGVGSILTLGGTAVGLLELGLGRLEAAVERLEETGRYSLEQGLENPAIAPWAQDLAEAYIRLGDRKAAERTLATLERQAERTGGRGAAAAAARCRGLLADDEEEAAESFDRALAFHDQRPSPFERARTELCFGERLRRAGRRVDARERLRRALKTFERLGADPWAEKARRELAASGERARRRAPDTRDELTAQELQVALVVAEGATNREAAAQLFVSPKTIETHLSHVYRKLEVRSRTELARTLHG